MPRTEQTEPQNLDAEIAALGACMTERRAIKAALREVTPEHFHNPIHAAIFAAIKTLHERDIAPDIISLEAELRAMPVPPEKSYLPVNPEWTWWEELERYAKSLAKDKTLFNADISDGLNFLFALPDRCLSPSNIGYYCEQVKEEAAARVIQRQARSAFKLSRTPEGRRELAAMNGEYNLSKIMKDGRADNHTLAPICLANVEVETVEWLWHGWLPVGKMVALSGDPGLYKSGITLDWCARITTGRAFPLTTLAREPANVLILAAEDGVADTIKPRIIAAGGDPARVFVHTPLTMPEFDIDVIERFVVEMKVSLIIVDTFTSFLPERADGQSSVALRRRFLSPLIQMLERTKCTLVGLHHLNKMAGITNSIYRSSGKLDFVAASRVAIVVGEDPQNDGAFVMAVSKGNLAKTPQSLRYHVENEEGATAPAVWWDGIAEGQSADSLMSDSKVLTQEELSPIEEAVVFLLTELDLEPVKVEDLKKRARDAGVSFRSLERAKPGLARSMRVKGIGKEGYWAWELLPECERDIKIASRLKHLTLVEGDPNTATNLLRPPIFANTANIHGTGKLAVLAKIGGLSQNGEELAALAPPDEDPFADELPHREANS